MIPKVIHYCWFGGGKQPELVKDCIDSWRQYCPDYEIKLWDESNFDIHQNKFCDEAYQSKKWAFVADYFRAWVLYNYGGIYFDSDVILKQNFNVFLKDKFFIGFEELFYVAPDTMGCEKGHPLAKAILNSFNDDSFIKEDGTFNLKVMPARVTDCIRSIYNIKKFYERKICLPNLTIYPKEFFSPIDYYTGRMKKSRKTHSVHLFNGSWIDNNSKRKYNAPRRLARRFKIFIKKRKIQFFG